MTAVGKAVVDVVFDRSQISRDLNTSIDGAGRDSERSIGTTFRRMAGVAAAAFASVQIFDFFKSVVGDAREANRVAAQTEAVIRSTGSAAGLTAEQFSELAESIAMKTGIDDEAIQSAENLLATFTNVTDAVGVGNDIFSQATMVMVDMGAALGQDAASSAIQLGKALNDPIAGITALTRVGVTFTQEQKDMIKSLVASGDIMGAQRIILAELTKEFGGSAEAQATAAGKLSVSWGNIKEELGNELIPVIDQVAQWLAIKLPVAFDTLKGWITDGKAAWIDFKDVGIGAVLQAYQDLLDMSDRVIGFLKEQQDILIPTTAALVSFLAALTLYTQATKAISGISAAFTALGPAISAAFAPLLANPIVLIIAGIIALGVAIYMAYKRFQAFRDVVDTVVSFVKDTAVKAFELAREWVGKLGDAFGRVAVVVGGFAKTVGEIASNIAGAVIGALTPIVKWISEHLGPVFFAIADFVDAAADRIRNIIELLMPVFEAIGAVLKFVAGIVIDVFVAAFKIAEPIVVGVMRVIGSILETVARVAIPILLAAFSAIKTVVEIVFNAIKSIIEGVLRVIQGIFQVFAGILRGDFSKIWEGLSNIVGGVWDAIKGIITGTFQAIIEFLKGMPKTIGDIIQALWDGVKQIFSDVWFLIIGVVSGAITAIVDFVKGIPARLLELGQSLLDAGANLGGQILEGLGNGLSGIVGFLGDIGDAVFEAFKSAWNSVVDLIVSGFQMAVDAADWALGPWVNFPDDLARTTFDFAYLHEGGMVPGPRGADVPAILQAGEFVMSRDMVENLGSSGTSDPFGGWQGDVIVNNPVPEEASESVPRQMKNLAWIMGGA